MINGEWNSAIDGYLAWLRAMGEDGGVAASTIETRRHQLQRTARVVGGDPWALSDDDLLAYWRTARGGWSGNTKRGHRAALRGFYAWAVQEGHVTRSPALVIPKVKPSPPNPSPTPEDVYRSALVASRPRERIMLVLAADHGLRRCEVAVVHSRDLIPDLDGWSLVVHGKGTKERIVPLTAEAATMLQSLPEGYAFPGRINGHLSPRRVGELIADLLPGRDTMHKLRHRAATRWREAQSEVGGPQDLRDVQELLGHATLATTIIYTKANTARMRRLVEVAA